MTADRNIIAAARSADGMKRWQLVQRDDGLFCYEEHVFKVEDLRQHGAGLGLYEYWSPTYVSGLFGTIREAQHDAVATLRWLEDSIVLRQAKYRLSTQAGASELKGVFNILTGGFALAR